MASRADDGSGTAAPESGTDGDTSHCPGDTRGAAGDAASPKGRGRPTAVPVGSKKYQELVPRVLAKGVCEQYSHPPDDVRKWAAKLDTASARQELRALMTVATRDFSEDVNFDMDALLQGELLAPGRVVEAVMLPRFNIVGRPALSNRISLWRGDITRLRIGAIVNAANAQMLGCFRPNHPVRTATCDVAFPPSGG